MIQARPFDKSEKAYEVLRKEYDFDANTRTALSISKWKHLRYYEAVKGAKDAIVAARVSRHAKYERNGKIRLTRYKWQKR